MKKSLTLFLIFLSYQQAFSQLNNVAYDSSLCGLNFIHKASVVATRGGGKGMPITFNISELPAGSYRIEKAFVWSTVSYWSDTPTNVLDTVIAPNGNVSIITAVLTGQQGPKCWGEIGTRGYRADVTNSISGNGNYTISTNTSDGWTDGLTLLIIYRNPAENYTGHLVIHDGLYTTSGDLSDSLMNINACANSTKAYAMLIASDFQNIWGLTLKFTMNGVTSDFSKAFWNSEVVSTNVTQNQNKSIFGITDLDSIWGRYDCYSWVMFGLYYQVNTTSQISISPKTATVCAMDSVTLRASGSLTSYEWSSIPEGFKSNSANITVSPSQTTKYIVKESNCSCTLDTAIVTVLQKPMAHAGADTGVCPGGSINIGKIATGGTPPFTYSWEPANELNRSDSSTVIAAPINNTNYIVTVTDANGCRSKDTVFVYINPLPKAHAGPSKGFCRGSSTTIEASATDGVPPYSYQWEPPDGLNRTDNAIVDASPSGNRYYTVTVTDSHGCTDKDSVYVFLYPELSIKSAKTYATCKGNSVALHISVSDGTPPYTFTWSPTYGLSDSTKVNPLASPDVSTTYYLTVRDKNGCVKIDTIYVIVNNALIVNAGKDTTICTGSTAKLGGSVNNGIPPCKYSWSPATGLSRTDSLFVEASPVKSTEYILTVTDSRGCTSSDTVTINISTAVDAKIKALTSTAICNGDSAILSAEPYAANYKYLWSSGENTDKIVVKKEGRVYLTIENEYGCKSSDSIDITVRKAPDIKITTDKPPYFCEGDSIALTAKPQLSGYSYLWSTGDTTKSITVKKSGFYQLEVKDEFGCLNSDSLEVKIAGSLGVKITASGSTTICGDSIELKAIPEGSEYSYLWSTGATTSRITAKQSGRYRVHVSLNNSCEGGDSIDVKIYPEPSVKITGSSSFCSGSTITLGTDKNFSSYLWSTGDTTREIKIRKAGRYKLTVTDENGCTASDSVNVMEKSISISGISDLDLGRICSGEETFKDLSLRNTGIDDVVINNIKFTDSIPVFSCSSFSKVIEPGNESKISIGFKPHQIGYYKDTIVIELSEPCPAEYKAEIKGTAYAKTLASLPVVIAEVGQVINIPLSLNLVCGDSLPGAALFNSQVSIDATAINSANAAQENGVQYLGISFGRSTYSLKSTIAEKKDINGLVMLAGNDTIPLIIDNLKWDNDLIENESQNGTLIITGLCERTLLHLIPLGATHMSVFPNPASDEAEIKVEGDRTGIVELNIYTIEGTKKYKTLFNKRNYEVSNKINLSDYGEGIYQIVAKIGEDIIYERIMIVK